MTKSPLSFCEGAIPRFSFVPKINKQGSHRGHREPEEKLARDSVLPEKKQAGLKSGVPRKQGSHRGHREPEEKLVRDRLIPEKKTCRT